MQRFIWQQQQQPIHLCDPAAAAGLSGTPAQRAAPLSTSATATAEVESLAGVPFSKRGNWSNVINMCLSVSTCVSVSQRVSQCLSVYLSVSTCVSVYVSVCLGVSQCLSVCLSGSLSVSRCVSQCTALPFSASQSMLIVAVVDVDGSGGSNVL